MVYGGLGRSMVVLGVWTAMVAKAPVDSGPASPQFLSVNFGSLFAFIFFCVLGRCTPRESRCP
jgi:hypothetical protein